MQAHIEGIAAPLGEGDVPLVEACGFNTDQATVRERFEHLAMISVRDRCYFLRCISDDLGDHFGLVAELHSVPSYKVRGQSSAGCQAGFAAVCIVCHFDCSAQSDMEGAGELGRALVCRRKPPPCVE